MKKYVVKVNGNLVSNCVICKYKVGIDTYEYFIDVEDIGGAAHFDTMNDAERAIEEVKAKYSEGYKYSFEEVEQDNPMVPEITNNVFEDFLDELETLINKYRKLL